MNIGQLFVCFFEDTNGGIHSVTLSLIVTVWKLQAHLADLHPPLVLSFSALLIMVVALFHTVPKKKMSIKHRPPPKSLHCSMEGCSMEGCSLLTAISRRVSRGLIYWKLCITSVQSTVTHTDIVVMYRNYFCIVEFLMAFKVN